ncbi:MAG: sugar ABC transporter ATP-binding protein [Ruminiclostridium sp.]
MGEYILEMLHISKQFPGVKALNDAVLHVKKGEIHALVGENGAGKSTLMKILSGVYSYGTYEGQIMLNGIEQRFSDIDDSIRAGLATIYQELALVKYMDITENIFLGHEIIKNGIIDYSQEYYVAERILQEVGLDIDPAIKVMNLGIGQQQLVEIAKAIVKDASIIILDEPTSALTEEESKNLLQLMKGFRERGITCIYISHKLNEVFEIADTITILRDGCIVSSHKTSELDENKLISKMVGREISQRFPKVEQNLGDTIFEVKNWTAYDPEIPDKKRLDNISLTLKRGEILGISGLMGAGRTEFALSLIGLFGINVTGEMILDGKKIVNKNPKDAIENRICYLTEDRKANGLVMGMDIKQNISLPNLWSISRNNVINESEEIKAAEKYCKDLKIITPSITQYVGNLSGGNQQKVCIGKWLMASPKVLILDEPTRGIDVGAKYEIYCIMNKLLEDGVSIIMISSELPEIIGMSNRILVMHEGRICGELGRDEATQEKIMFSAIGGRL